MRSKKNNIKTNTMKKKNELRLFQRIKNGTQEFFITKILANEVMLIEMQVNQHGLQLGKTFTVNKNEIQ